MGIEKNDLHIFLATEDYEADLVNEIKYRRSLTLEKKDQSVFWVRGPKKELWWPQWQLWHVQREKTESISQAIKILKSKGRNWLNLDYKFHRRCALIQDGLPKVKIKDLVRGEYAAQNPCGAWFLEENDILCYSSDISIPYRNGIVLVPDDKSAPSRAYRKLDEVFARLGVFPSKTEVTMDMGSFPGGWTWVLSHLAGKVHSVDTVALEGDVSKLKNVHGIRKDAFKVKPEDIGKLDWFFSDIICEPARLFELVNQWRDSGLVKNFVCTIKFKGTVDFNLLEKFQSIPNSKIFHQNANKHELTWVCLS